MVIRALAFDFDGLILDTEEPWFECWQETYRQHGCELVFADYAALIGTSLDVFDPYLHLEKVSGRPVDRIAITERHRLRYDELIRLRAILPGIQEYLDDARRLGLKVGIASSSTRDWVLGHLGRLGIHGRFDAIRTAEDVARVKPDPALYIGLAEAMGVEPAATIAIEDSPNGVRAAKAAGMYCVAVPNVLTSRLPLDAADLRLDSLLDLPLERLLARIAN